MLILKGGRVSRKQVTTFWQFVNQAGGNASEEFIEDTGESADPDQETEAVTSSPGAEQENEIEQNPR